MPVYTVLADMDHPQRGMRPLKPGDEIELTRRQALPLRIDGKVEPTVPPAAAPEAEPEPAEAAAEAAQRPARARRQKTD